MRITKKWLEKNLAAKSWIKIFDGQKESYPTKVIKYLVDNDNFVFANWMLIRVMNDEQRKKYGLACCELVLDIYENASLGDKTLREAVNSISEDKTYSKRLKSDVYTKAVSDAALVSLESKEPSAVAISYALCGAVEAAALEVVRTLVNENVGIKKSDIEKTVIQQGIDLLK